jgi:hypothetical protein
MNEEKYRKITNTNNRGRHNNIVTMSEESIISEQWFKV